MRTNIKYGDFLSSLNFASASWLWKGIQKIKPFLLAGACLRVSMNSFAPIWSSNWFPTIPTFKPGPKFPLNKHLHALLVRDLIDPTLVIWKTLAIHNLFDSFSANEILKIRISEEIGTNYLWAPSTNGKFTVSSAYRFLSKVSSNNASSSNFSQFWKSLWKLNLNDRLRLFLWKIA
jgi:hypothetical protein